MFPELKKELRRIVFDSFEEIQFSVLGELRKQSENGYKDMYQNWIHRHKRCLEAKGEYFDKN